MNRDTRRTRLLLALLLVTSVALITVDYRGGDSSPLSGLRWLAATVFGPIEQATSSIASPISSAVDNISHLGNGKDRINSLTRQNQELRRRLRTSQLDRNRAAELDKLLRTAGAGRYRVLPAQVIAVGPAQSFSWTVTIDAGSQDGITPDMTVLNGDGLVGRVKTVGPTTATVLLVVDPESAVGVRLEATMQVGITSGQGISDHSRLSMQLLDSQSDVKPGDRVVTFGSQGDSPYVPGVPVGVVTSVQGSPGSLTRTASVDPYVDFTSLDLVAVVVQPPRHNPRDSVLPPRPSPSSSPSPSGTASGTPSNRKHRSPPSTASGG
ncbi:MAG: rod shape-determining protein MreC [Actinomycetota bacterium]|jgi:rod shape-determining protein MreC|nr:rod shape-determining protein MreC [Actinomycetota bacterium]